MADMAFYPAVALFYFFSVQKGSKENRLLLDNSASINVFCLFVIAQPLCLILGGYTGMIAFLIIALLSYNRLPWQELQQAKERADKEKEASPKQKKKTN